MSELTAFDADMMNSIRAKRKALLEASCGNTRDPNDKFLTPAQVKLKAAGYDPIEELIMLARMVEIEVERQERMRTGELVELTPSGKPRAYRAEVHQEWLNKQAAIADKLLRYQYARVSETVVVDNKPRMPVVINLHKDRETMRLNLLDVDTDETPVEPQDGAI